MKQTDSEEHEETFYATRNSNSLERILNEDLDMTIVINYANDSKIERSGEFLKVDEYNNPKVA